MATPARYGSTCHAYCPENPPSLTPSSEQVERNKTGRFIFPTGGPRALLEPQLRRLPQQRANIFQRAAQANAFTA